MSEEKRKIEIENLDDNADSVQKEEQNTARDTIVIENLDETGEIPVGVITEALENRAAQEQEDAREELRREAVQVPQAEEKEHEREEILPKIQVSDLDEEEQSSEQPSDDEDGSDFETVPITARAKTAPRAEQSAVSATAERRPVRRPAEVHHAEGRRPENAAARRNTEEGAVRRADGSESQAQNARRSENDPRRAQRETDDEPRRKPEGSKNNPKGSNAPRRKKKKGKGKIVAAVAAILIVAAAGGYGVYAVSQNNKMKAYYEDHFLPGTFINSIDCSEKTVAEVEELFAQEAKDYTLTITDVLSQTDVITASDINLEADYDVSFQSLMDGQDVSNWRKAEQNPVNYEAGNAWSFDEVLLSKRIEASPLFQNMTTSKDAEILYNETMRLYELQPEVIGTKIDLKQVEQLAIEAVKSVQHDLVLADSGLYSDVVKADDAMAATVNALNAHCKGTVDFLFDPEPKESMPTSVVKEALVLDASNNVTINTEPISAWIDELAAKYNTYGTAREFESTSSGTVTLADDGTYGWKMNKEETLKVAVEALETGVPYEGGCIWDQKAASHKIGADWGNEYVEIDLNVQEVYFYRDGSCLWSSSCVSGNPAKNNRTITGVYSIQSKERNRTLRGPQADNGTYAYTSFVSYWMPFCGGYGLHDASWRSSFGGSIYKRSGSHGCVNLPTWEAPELYDLISVGTPVIVFGGIANNGSMLEEETTAAPTTTAETTTAATTAETTTQAPETSETIPTPAPPETEPETEAPETEPETQAPEDSGEDTGSAEE